MTAGRGDRAAPPAPDGHWEVRFADAASAKGWDNLAQQARENTYRAWITMRTAPDRPPRQPGTTASRAGTWHPPWADLRAVADRGDRRRPHLVSPRRCPGDVLDHLRGYGAPASHRPALTSRWAAEQREGPARSLVRRGSAEVPRSGRRSGPHLAERQPGRRGGHGAAPASAHLRRLGKHAGQQDRK